MNNLKGINLTPTQANHLESAKWLLSDENMGSGRTTVMILAIIDNAINSLGKPQKLKDHYCNFRGLNQYGGYYFSTLQELLGRVLNEDKYTYKISKAHLTLTINEKVSGKFIYYSGEFKGCATNTGGGHVLT